MKFATNKQTIFDNVFHCLNQITAWFKKPKDKTTPSRIHSSHLLLISMFATLGLAACSGGEVPKTGVFLDSAVEGVKYKTSSKLEGVTNAAGEYKYKLGDTVEFTVGNVVLGTVKADSLITVFDLNNPEEVAMLLQSIDEDSNPNNGIKISKETFQKFNNAKFTISEIDPESIAFTKKYSSLIGKEFTINRDSTNKHAVNTLKKELIDKIDPQLFQYIVNNQYNNASNLLGTGKNPKDYVKSLRAKLRMYFTFEYINDFVGADIEMMSSIMDSKENTRISVSKKLNSATDKWTKFFAIAGITSSGYKNITQLQQLKTAFASTANYVPTALLTKLFKETALDVTGGIAQNKILNDFVSITDDPELNKKLLDCVGALVPNKFSQLQCFSRAAGEIGVSLNNIFYNIQSIQALRKRNALYVTRRYLNMYYAFDASNHPQVLAEAFTQLAKSKLSPKEAASYQFATFDPSNDTDLEKALDLIAISDGFLPIDYSFIEAKNNITKYHTLIGTMTNDYIDRIGLGLLNGLDNKYLGIQITLEPDFNSKYKTCVNLENISNVNLKSITGNLNFQLDGVALGKSTIFTINELKTTNNFEQRCSEPFGINNIGNLLSLGLIKVSYNIKYLPVLYGSVEKKQVGSEYFEINKRMLALATAKPIVKIVTPVTAKVGSTVQLDASQTTSLYPGDLFSYTWEYLSSNISNINLVNANSSIASLVIPELPVGKLVLQLKFRVTVTSLNGLSSSKEVYIYAKQGVKNTTQPAVTPPNPLVLTFPIANPLVPKANNKITAFLAAATAIDSAGITLAVTNDAPVKFPAGTRTVTFTATDAAGLIGTATATVTIKAAPVVKDTTPPIITLKGAVTVTVNQGQNYTDLGATAFDVVDGYVTALKTSTVNTSSIGAYKVTYNASDLSGNAAIPVVRTVNVVAATTPVVTTLNNGLVAYYPFDGYANDMSGNGNNGTVFGGATYVKGAVGQGIKLNGVNSIGGTANPDHIMVANSTTLQFSTAMSVSYWVRIDGNMAQTSANCSGSSIAGIHGTTIAKRGDRFGFTFDEYELGSSFSINPWNGGKGLGSGTIATAYQQFRHLTYVVNGQNISAYVNGVLAKTGVGVVDFATANLQDLYMGVAQNLNGACMKFWYPLDGVIDDVRIYNRALTATEVLALASGNLPNQAPVPTAPAISTTVGTAATSQIAANDPNFLDTHSYAVSTAAVNGTVSVDSYGLATYTPNAAYVGADSFVVTVTDNTGLSGSVTVNVAVVRMPTAGLLAYYPFDGNANDVSGNGANGTVFGGVTYPTGVKGQAASFHNVNNPSFYTVNDYIQLPNITLSNSFAFTYSALFRSDAHYHNCSIYSIGDNSNGIFFAHFVSPSGQSWFSFLNNSIGIASSAIQVNLSDKAWHHFIVNINNNQVEVYDKGVFIGSAILTKNMSFQNAPNYLALNQWYNGAAMSSRFNGMVDELRIYNRSLTATELATLTSGGSINKPPVPTAPAISSTAGAAATSQIAANDPNAADTHTYVVSTAAVNGTASVDAAGLTTYTPNAAYVGADSFVVTVTDGRGLAGLVTVNVTVQ